ncbi:MAG: LacI family DNA-binding transcriptional regulator [Spirochaetales bacterium]|nr:LacI family DNA-binding transcriptional regulator [Spirochaetales bacterium]
MVTISDVASYCGVNESTVSRVLNNSSKISRETTERVKEAVKILGYKPVRKRIKKKAPRNITFVIPNTALYTLGGTLKEFSATLHDTDYEIHIFNLHQRRDVDVELAELLCKKDTAGLILYGCIIPEDAAKVFYANNMPVVAEQSHTSHLVSYCVNNYNGIRDAVNYVVSRGYRRIGFIGWKPEDFNIRERYNSYKNVMEEHDLERDMIYFGPQLDMMGGYEATDHLWEMYKPEVLVFAADILAYGGIKYLKEQGISYPNDIGLIGFDDAYPSELLGLTSMYQLLDENAHLVMESLMDMIKNKTVHPAKEVLLTPKLIRRDSLK